MFLFSCIHLIKGGATQIIHLQDTAVIFVYGAILVAEFVVGFLTAMLGGHLIIMSRPQL